MSFNYKQKYIKYKKKYIELKGGSLILHSSIKTNVPTTDNLLPPLKQPIIINPIDIKLTTIDNTELIFKFIESTMRGSTSIINMYRAKCDSYEYNIAIKVPLYKDGINSDIKAVNSLSTLNCNILPMYVANSIVDMKPYAIIMQRMDGDLYDFYIKYLFYEKDINDKLLKIFLILLNILDQVICLYINNMIYYDFKITNVSYKFINGYIYISLIDFGVYIVGDDNLDKYTGITYPNLYRCQKKSARNNVNTEDSKPIIFDIIYGLLIILFSLNSTNTNDIKKKYSHDNVETAQITLSDFRELIIHDMNYILKGEIFEPLKDKINSHISGDTPPVLEIKDLTDLIIIFCNIVGELSKLIPPDSKEFDIDKIISGDIQVCKIDPAKYRGPAAESPDPAARSGGPAGFGGPAAGSGGPAAEPIQANPPT